MKNFFTLIIIALLHTTSSTARDYQNYTLPDTFDDAMISHVQDTVTYKKFLQRTPQKELLYTIKQSYEQFVQTIEQHETQVATIPKIIHQIWIGPYDFPEEALEWQATWQALHPDWEYKLWTNKDLESLTLINQTSFDQARNWGEKADILRLELLYEYGGLYVDIDFACYKPFDWLHHTCDFYTALHTVKLLNNNKVRIANGLIGCTPKHPIIKHAIQQIPQYRTRKMVTQRTGPDFFTDVIAQSITSSQSTGNTDIVFPANYFYPRGTKGGRGCRIRSGGAYIKPETMAAHYYTSYWIRPPGTQLTLQESERKQHRKERLAEQHRLQAAGQCTKKRRIKKRRR